MGSALLKNPIVVMNESGLPYTNGKLINGYTVVIKYSDKKLIDCMKNVIKRTLAK